MIIFFFVLFSIALNMNEFGPKKKKTKSCSAFRPPQTSLMSKLICSSNNKEKLLYGI